MYCYVKSVVGLGPNLATATYTLLTLPLVIIFDFYYDKNAYSSISNMYLLGAILVLFSFFAISILELIESIQAQRLEKIL